MNPESIHEDFNEDVEPVAEGDLDTEPRVAPDEGGEPQDISEGPAPGESVDTEAEATAEPEQPAGAEAKASDEKTVPYGALHAEREMRKELQAQLAENQKALGQMLALKEQINELRKGSEQNAAEADSKAEEERFEEDPIAVLKEKQDALQAKLAAADKEKESASEQQNQLRQFMGEVTRQVAEYEQDHPDYSQAFQFLMDKRMEEYKAFGMDANEMQMAFDREALQIAQGAMARGKNPGEVAYAMAEARGYVKTDKPDPATKPASESLEETMDRLEKGSQAAQTNQGGNSTVPDDTPSLSDISKMSDKDFDAYWAEMEKAAGRGSIM